MLGTDRDAVICDLAETYHLFDMDSVPLMTLATLCAGLPEDSRIKLHLNGVKRIPPSFTLVTIADTLTQFVYAFSGSDKTPTLYKDIMIGKQKKKSNEFKSISDFEKARRKILNG